MTESQLMREVMLAVSKAGCRIFRNNVAKGWIGASVGPFTHDTVVTVRAGSVVIADARRLHSGLCVGSTDLVGWTPRIVTPEMVGASVGLFTGLETKSKRGRLTAEQVNFIEQVRTHGGVAGEVRSVDDAIKLVGLSPTSSS